MAEAIAVLPNSIGNCRDAVSQSGVLVIESSVAVYVAMTAPVAAPASPAARSTVLNLVVPVVSRRSCVTAAMPLAAPNAPRTQEPMLMGEVRRTMRSMLYQRDGVCRSRMSSTGLMSVPMKARYSPVRTMGRCVGQPKRSAIAAIIWDAPVSPPTKKYDEMSQPQGLDLTTGRP